MLNITDISAKKTIRKTAPKKLNANFQRLPRKKKQVSFGNAKSDGTKIILDQMTGPMGQIVKRIQNIKLGEISNISINAIGTGIIAPFFIAFNPLSKTDEQTKKYSALRQPVSAVLTIATQIGMLIPFSSLLEKLYNTGQVGEKGGMYDLSLHQEEKFIAKQLKAKHPEWSKDKLAKAAETAAKKNLKALNKTALEKLTIEKAGHTYLGQNAFLQTMKKTAENIIQETIELGEMAGKDLLKEGKGHKELSSDDTILKQIIKLIKENETANKIKETISDHAEKEASSTEKQTITKVEATLKRGGESVIEDIHDITKNHKPSKKGPLHSALEQIIDEQKFVNKIKGLAEKLTTTNIINETVNTHISDLKKTIKADRDISSSIFSLAILPFTCMALNWVYPRFMEIAFPDLVKAKKSKGGGE